MTTNGRSTTDLFLRTFNGKPVAAAEVPVVGAAEFHRQILSAVARGGRIAALYGLPQRCLNGGKSAENGARLFAVLAFAHDGQLGLLSADVGDAYPSLTPDCPQAHWFEREIAEQWGIKPVGHPWLKPIRFHRSYTPGRDAWGRSADAPILPGVTDYFRVTGEEVHEVAVGPVHAGIIEPGHFRFQCHGENVFHLEIELGYQHRGVERHLVGGPTVRTRHYLETLAGDSTLAHATAYSQAVEGLAGVRAPVLAQTIRAMALELERLANHTGDLGALAGDVGYLPTASYCGRIRGDFLNMTALFCGNRFGRGLVRPGGVGGDADAERLRDLENRLKRAKDDVTEAVELLWQTPSVLARLEDTGTISRQTCEVLGLVGPTARACGVEQDVRYDFPAGWYAMTHIPVSSWPSGDVFARAFVRWLEMERSLSFLLEEVAAMPEGDTRLAVGELTGEQVVVSLMEGWRGEVCHVAVTGADGKFAHYKVVDPSFHNWFGLAMALRGQQISDFPLCNKSFNLSYCGHDL